MLRVLRLGVVVLLFGSVWLFGEALFLEPERDAVRIEVVVDRDARIAVSAVTDVRPNGDGDGVRPPEPEPLVEQRVRQRELEDQVEQAQRLRDQTLDEQRRLLNEGGVVELVAANQGPIEAIPLPPPPPPPPRRRGGATRRRGGAALPVSTTAVQESSAQPQRPQAHQARFPTPEQRVRPYRAVRDHWNTANFEPYLMVIGMHRSLTSGLVQALAETMNFRLASYYTANWELSEVQVANDLLLQFSQSRWDHVNLPLDRPAWPTMACITTDVHHIQYLNAGPLVTQEPRTGALVLKDPRFALTLPYWQRCLPKPPHVVFIFRSPIEVARSLEKRDAMPLRRGIELWYQYNKLGLMHISSVNHTIIESRDLLDQPHKTLEFLFDVLSNQWQLPRLLAPLDGGALHVAHTSSRPPTDREDLERQVGEALQQELGGAVTLFDVMELYDELMRRRFSVQTIPAVLYHQ